MTSSWTLCLISADILENLSMSWGVLCGHSQHWGRGGFVAGLQTMEWTSKKMAFMVYTPSKILNANYVATCPIKHVRLPIYLSPLLL